MGYRSYIRRYVKEYKPKGLEYSKMLSNPIAQFERWYKFAARSNPHEPNAMVVATCNRSGTPSARVMLLKSFDKLGFTFFSNYKSKKAGELAANKKAALVFYWPELFRQVRIVGKVRKLSAHESDQYFATRPKGAKLGAHASKQSSVINDINILANKIAKLRDKFKRQEIPRPAHWGGYILIPQEIEFWQGRPNRLHDRFRYRRNKTRWIVERLSP